MRKCRLRKISLPVRDHANNLLGKTVYMGIDVLTDELQFAVLKINSDTGENEFVVLPGVDLHSRRTNQPDEIILDLSQERIRRSVKMFGFSWPRLVCPSWAVQLKNYLAACEKRQCCGDYKSGYHYSELN